MVGLIGHKLKHSLSKIIHEKIVDRNYQLIELTKVDDFLNKKEFEAINVTIPYKESVLPFLQNLDPLAKEIGSVNTIVNRKGILHGYNTDYPGLEAMLKHFKIDLQGKDVLILGNGATAKMVELLSKKHNASSVRFVVRTLKQSDEILVSSLTELDDVDLIINTTPVGLYPATDAKPFADLSFFPNTKVVIDLIYNPLSTRLLLDAKKRGLIALNGLYMLVAQAVYAEEIFLQKILDSSLIDKIYQELMYESINIVLIGMPTSGKSTIGRLLSYELKRPFYDIDTLVEETFGNIASIFSEHGEVQFREYETLTTQEIAKKQGVVISTGGGIIKKIQNIDYLKQNGILVFINRDLETLIHQDYSNRPLVKSLQDLRTLHQQRYQLYLDYSDIIVDNNTTFSDVIQTIKEKVHEIISH